MLTKKRGAIIAHGKYTKGVHRQNLQLVKKVLPVLPVLISCHSIYNSNYEKLWRPCSNDKGLGLGCGRFQVLYSSWKDGQHGGVVPWIGV